MISNLDFYQADHALALQLLYCVHKWINELENDHTVAIFYTDFRKAFDSVSHCKLIRRLEMLEIAGMLLTWVVSFLTERKQRVRVGDMGNMCHQQRKLYKKYVQCIRRYKIQNTKLYLNSVW